MRTLKDLLDEFYAMSVEERRTLLAKVLDGVDLSGLPRAAANAARFAAAIKPLLEDLKRATESSRFRFAQDLERASADPWCRALIHAFNAKLAREARERPEILDAIVAERDGHNDPAEHPYTVARRILDKVNARLKKAGYEPTCVDVIARKIPTTKEVGVFAVRRISITHIGAYLSGQTTNPRQPRCKACKRSAFRKSRCIALPMRLRKPA